MKTKSVALAGAALLGLSVLVMAGTAAASVYFAPGTTTSAATSTPAFMTPGTATSTLTYNTYTGTNVATATPSGSVAPTAATSVTLLGAFTGSSTVSTLKITPEYSQDGIDWYQGYGILVKTSTSTPNPTYAYSYVDSINVPYASTTSNGSASTQAVDRFAITVPVPTKNIRFVVSLTGANGAFWGQVVPAKLNP